MFLTPAQSRASERLRDVSTTADMLGIVKRRFGEYHSYLTEEVICYDWDISGSPEKVKVLTDSLQFLVENDIPTLSVLT
jgi:hypothetical protein